MTQLPHEIVPLDDGRRAWADALIVREWAGPALVSRGRVHDTRALPGFVALLAGRPAGLALYRVEQGECELVSLNSLAPGQGIGGALIEAVCGAARAAGCRRVWLITTNDNGAALRFYQKRGFRLVALYPGALDVSRRLKPQIPLKGIDGIPLRDEIELEIDCLQGRP